MKIKNQSFLFLLLTSLLVTCLFTACEFIDREHIRGNGNIFTEERKVNGVRDLQVSGAFVVVLSQNDDEGVKIETDENLMDYIQVEVLGGTLKIYSTANLSPTKKMLVHISFKSLDEIDISGAVRLSSEHDLSFNRIRLHGSGASEIDLGIEAVQIGIDVSGASKVSLRGSAENLSVDGSGASKIYAADLQCEIVNVNISGASYAEVWADDKLSVEASGASKVKYKGSVTNIRQSTSGASDVIKM